MSLCTSDLMLFALLLDTAILSNVSASLFSGQSGSSHLLQVGGQSVGFSRVTRWLERQSQAIAWESAGEGNLSAGSENCRDSILWLTGRLLFFVCSIRSATCRQPTEGAVCFVQGSCSTALRVMALASVLKAWGRGLTWAAVWGLHFFYLQC